MKKTNFKNLFVAVSLLIALTSCSNGSDDFENPYKSSTDDWLDTSVPSLYETYKDYFDYVGFAVEYGIKGWNETELSFTNVQKGLSKHANSITMGNEFKPDFVMAWWDNNPTISGTFIASNGLTIDTPVLNGFDNVDAILTICKNNNLKMRGHTLAWHSQTPESFFRKDYKKTEELVSAKEMDARLEWYIKTVLEHVDNWEKKNNNGKHIIWAWDVFNEVTPDGQGLLRTNSKWYQIYNNSDFLVHAFQYANKYAPADVKLVYNDYGGVYGTNFQSKHNSQMELVEIILSHKDDTTFPTRLDAMGLQSHYSVITSKSIIQREIQDFVNKGIDVHITELDIGTFDNYNNSKDKVGTANKQYNSLAEAYKAFFQVYIENRKTDSKHGVESITIWGLNDENTWLNTPSQQQYLGNCTQYPLLFTKKNNSYYPKGAFFAVIDAAE